MILYRLGLVEKGVSVEKTIYKARALNPQFPKLIDLPLWEIGHYQVTAGFVGSAVLPDYVPLVLYRGQATV